MRIWRRIISDYAHERWEASRTVPPHFWRPVGPFIDETLLADMKRLFASFDIKENQAAALCCHQSKNTKAAQLLAQYPVLEQAVASNQLQWKHI